MLFQIKMNVMIDVSKKVFCWACEGLLFEKKATIIIEYA